MDIDVLAAIVIQHQTGLLAEADRERLNTSLRRPVGFLAALATGLRGLADRLDGRRSVIISTRLA
jgi:hypothetical protein